MIYLEAMPLWSPRGGVVVALLCLWTNLASVTLRVLAPYGNDAVCRTLYWFV
jgi:hypothetical protein